MNIAFLVALAVSAPSPAETLAELPNLAHFVAATPVVVDGWLAFRERDTIVKLAPVPAAEGALTCTPLPKHESDWAGYWLFPSEPPVVLHLAEAPTMLQWWAAKKCWAAHKTEEPPATLKRRAAREPEVIVSFATLGLPGYQLVDREGTIALTLGALVLPLPKNEAAIMLGRDAEGEAWARHREPEEGAPEVVRTYEARVVAAPVRTLVVVREARWKTDGAEMGGAVTGKRLTSWHIDISDTSAPRLTMVRDGAFSDRKGDGAFDAAWDVTRNGRQQMPGAVLEVALEHRERVRGHHTPAGETSSWRHRARFTLRDAAGAIELWPVFVAPPALAGKEPRDLDVLGRKIEVVLGTRLIVRDQGLRSLSLYRAGTNGPVTDNGGLGVVVGADHVAVLASLNGQRGRGSVHVLLPLEQGGPTLLLKRTSELDPRYD